MNNHLKGNSLVVVVGLLAVVVVVVVAAGNRKSEMIELGIPVVVHILIGLLIGLHVPNWKLSEHWSFEIGQPERHLIWSGNCEQGKSIRKLWLCVSDFCCASSEEQLLNWSDREQAVSVVTHVRISRIYFTEFVYMVSDGWHARLPVWHWRANVIQVQLVNWSALSVTGLVTICIQYWFVKSVMFSCLWAETS